MRARVVLASAAIHISLVIALIVAGTAAGRRSVIDVEIAATPVVTTELALPPAPPPEGPPGGRPAIEPIPVRSVEPARRPRLHRAPPAPAPVAPAPPATEVDPSAPPAGDGADGEAAADAGGGDGGGSGSGLGAGTGHGFGDGTRDLDLSARPIPLDPNLSPTLPYTEEAARGRISGDVQLVLTVDPLGRVGRVAVRRGLGHGLDEIAIQQAMKIRFRPARDRAGRPTVGTVRWRYHFERP